MVEHADLSGNRATYRGSLTSLEDGEQLLFHTEPKNIAYSAERRDVDELPFGHSHEVSTYSGTASERVSFDIEYRRGVLQYLHGWGRDQAIEQMEEFRRFVRAHLATPEYPDGLLGGAPPELHLDLPGRLSLKACLIATNFTQPDHDDIDLIGGLRRFMCGLRFREAPPVRMTYNQLRQVGYFRW